MWPSNFAIAGKGKKKHGTPKKKLKEKVLNQVKSMAYSTLMHAYVQAQACASKKVNSLLLEVTKTSTPGGDDPGVCVCVCVCFFLFAVV